MQVPIPGKYNVLLVFKVPQGLVLFLLQWTNKAASLEIVLMEKFHFKKKSCWYHLLESLGA